MALLSLTPPLTIFEFTSAADFSAWRVVDDGVMGGLSEGLLQQAPEGHAIYRGDVSLENNGGFSSLRYRFQPKVVEQFSTVRLHIKGDGKKYQLRFKSSLNDYHSYIAYFTTSGEWETIELPIKDMYPTFRGRRLNMDNYPAETLAEVAFLIGNKKAESFQLEIEKIELK